MATAMAFSTVPNATHPSTVVDLRIVWLFNIFFSSRSTLRPKKLERRRATAFFLFFWFLLFERPCTLTTTKNEKQGQRDHVNGKVSTRTLKKPGLHSIVFLR